jgi:hypothetical protein
MRTQFSARASVDYYLPKKVSAAKIRVLDARGEELGSQAVETDRGFHHADVSLSRPGFGTFQGMVLWSGYSMQLAAPPGNYTVELTAGAGTKLAQQFRLTKDPRVPASERDLQEQYRFSVEISGRVNDANLAVARIIDEIAQIDKAVGSTKDAALGAQASALKDRLIGVEGEVYQYRSHSGEDPLNYPIKLNDKLAGVLSAVQSGQFAPTQQAREVFAILSKQLQVQLNALKAIESKEVPALNATLKARGMAPIVPKNPQLQRGGGFGEFAPEEESDDRE